MSSAARRVSLRGSLGLRDVAPLAEEFGRALASSGPLTVDCTELNEIDLSVIQLIVSAYRTAMASGRSLTVRHPAGGPLERLLVAAGFIAGDGSALTSDGQFWTSAEAGAA